MRALDLCAGAGGLSLGLQRAGFSVLGVELDRDACATHARHVGPCVRADLREFSVRPGFDLVAGGVPCQSFSKAGKRAGLSDPRGQLARQFFRVVRETGARAFLLENVPEAEGALLGYAHSEAPDFRLSAAILDAADFGVPQHRRRFFLAGVRGGGFRWPVPTHGTAGLFGELRRYVTTREATGIPYDAPAPCVTATEHKATANFGSRGAKTNPRRCGDRLGVIPTEAQYAALQGFPECWTWAGNKESRLRQIGNAVPPALGEAVGRSIFDTLTASQRTATEAA